MNKEINPQTAYTQTAPTQYINRPGALDEAGLFISVWGKRAYISAGHTALNMVRDRLLASLAKYDIAYDYQVFEGECCDDNIDRIVKAAGKFNADVIICAGGGKSLDTGKAAAAALKIPIVCIPTIAATCAAASAVSVVYNNKGEFLRDIYYFKNPELVIVEPDIIANAPVRYLSSGIIDSLSKWYEGRAAMQGIENPDVYTRSAIALAKLLNDLLVKDAAIACEQVRNHQTGRELIDVIDINIYLTAVIQSMGQASTRGAAAHPLQGGMSLVKGSHELLHGVKVAYGIVVQMFMEVRAKEEIHNLIEYFHGLGVTTSLKALNLPNDTETMRIIAEKANRDPLMRKMPVPVDVDVIVDAMKHTEIFVNDLYVTTIAK